MNLIIHVTVYRHLKRKTMWLVGSLDFLSRNKHYHYKRFILYRFGYDSSIPYALDEVDCIFNSFLVILQCRHSTIISPGCSINSDEVSVTCGKCYILKVSAFMCHCVFICVCVCM